LHKSGEASKSCTYNEITRGLQIVRNMFLELDVDSSGDISMKELQNGFRGLGDSELCDQRMAELDFNRDSRIEYFEFCVGISIWVGFVDEEDQ